VAQLPVRRINLNGSETGSDLQHCECEALRFQLAQKLVILSEVDDLTYLRNVSRIWEVPRFRSDDIARRWGSAPVSGVGFDVSPKQS
jgi:hypothetical protein